MRGGTCHTNVDDVHARATLTSLLFTMGGRIGDLASGFDGVAAAQLVISALLFVLAVFLMVEGLRTLNAQRRARLSEGA